MSLVNSFFPFLNGPWDNMLVGLYQKKENTRAHPKRKKGPCYDKQTSAGSKRKHNAVQPQDYEHII